MVIICAMAACTLCNGSFDLSFYAFLSYSLLLLRDKQCLSLRSFGKLSFCHLICGNLGLSRTELIINVV